MRVRHKALDQVLETFKLPRSAGTALKSDPEWRLLDAVEGEPAPYSRRIEPGKNPCILPGK